MSPEEIVQAVVDLAAGMSRPAYRGQAQEKWPLQPGALRRLSKAYGDDFPDDKNGQMKMVDEYHQSHLIEPMQVIDGSTLSELQRLSVLQHQGAATGLLDFTEFPLVALWFACTEWPDQDARVFVLDIGNPQLARNARLSKQLMDNPFDAGQRPGDTSIYYEPDRPLGARIVAQKSVFVIGNPQISASYFKSVIVPQRSKEQLCVYLKRLGVSETVLFEDIPGLAAANTARTELRVTGLLSPEQHRDRGNRAYQAGRFDNALADYESYGEALPDVAQPYCLQGDALAALGRFEEAQLAYSRAVQNLNQPIYLGEQVVVAPNVARMMARALYYNRGNVRAASGDHEGALEDFDMALQQGFQPQQCVLFNRGNSKFALRRFDEAHQDFEAVWLDQKGSASALAMGNCKVMVGAFGEALQQYLDGSATRPDASATHCRNNGEQVKQILRALDGNDYQVSAEGLVVFVEAEGAAGHFPFAGNSGNTGNFPSGMVNAHGGKGYGGSAGFAVVITSPNQ